MHLPCRQWPLPTLLWLLAFTLASMCAAAESEGAKRDLPDARRAGAVLWGADESGGAPYEFRDPVDPAKRIGFEVDIADELARRIGLPIRFRQTQWDQLIPALERGDFDMAMSGIEITDERRQVVDFTHPYYVYTLQLVVRADDKSINSLDDCRGKRIGTLSATAAERRLQKTDGVEVVSFDDNVRPYEDLALGRIDGVLLDLPLAVHNARHNPKLRFAGEPIAPGLYAIAIRKGSPELLDALNRAIDDMVRDGSLKRILQKWDLWNNAQMSLSENRAGSAPSQTAGEGVLHFAPLLLRGTLVTIQISLLAMAIATALGICLALVRVYGSRLFAGLALVYVEVMRGTPLLIQLYFIYYGLPQIPGIGFKLSSMMAAVLGVGLNYAAYAAEIYRAGLMAIPRSQTEAALALGLSRTQAVRLVVLPQALRVVIPPVTNDFVALFKDTSIVSMLAIAELTQTFRTASIATGRYLEFAVVTALIYFAISYPISRLARVMEKRIHPHHDFDTQPY